MAQDLAKKLTDLVTQLSRRSDLEVTHYLEGDEPLDSSWKAILPADMFAFYSQLNGLAFMWKFHGEEGLHGINLKALRDGGGTASLMYERDAIPHQPATEYGEYFFDEAPCSPDTKVLFFAGEDDSAGLLMVGAGDGATFYTWNNDGYVTPLGNSFTSIIEKMIASKLASMWYEEGHRDNQRVMERLSS